MGYKVDFDALDTFNTNINTQISNWSEELGSISTAVTNIQNSTNMSGAAADSVRLYFENVHGIILSLLSQLLSSQQTNCFLYKRDYFSNVDTALHAVIKESELNDIKSEIDSHNKRAIAVEDEISAALSKIKDIFYVSYKDVSDVDAAHTSLSTFLNDLDEEIKNLEDDHYINDFNDTDLLISSLNEFITEQKNQSRSYKSSFDINSLSNSQSFRQLYEAYLSVSKEQEEKAALLEQEIKNEEQRKADLQAEYEERQKKATIINWVVTGVCIIGSVVAIAATGGAATPLVIGAISATSSAIIAGTNNLTSQYVEHGNLIENSDKINWGSLAKDVAVGAATGFVTGYVGAGISSAITNFAGNTAIGSTLLNSSSSLTRFATGAVIGSVSEVSSGIVTRGAAATIEGVVEGDLNAKDVVGEMFDGKRILVDASIGGVSGGVTALKKPVGKQISADEYKNDKFLKDTKPDHSPNPEKWLEDGGKIYVDGNGTWTYEAPDGVAVVYSNEYPDFDRAGLVKTEHDTGGFNTDNHSTDIRIAQKQTGLGGKGSGDTWHHNEDGHTLQLIDRVYHELFRHKGGFSKVKRGG